MKVFVTGGTGFIGSRLIEKLVERGDQVYALTRSANSAAKLAAAGAEPVWGNVTDKESMRDEMHGSDLVFHLAGWYKLGSRDVDQAENINVHGTRNVLELAYELDIPKVVYTSSLVVYGDTHGQVVDETYHMPDDQPFLTEYDRTKWMAHYEVALPLMEAGAPVIIVLPGAVFGPGDDSLVGQMMRAYTCGWMPFFPGPDTVLSYTYVDDIVEGHLLAAEKGQPGEEYILTGPPVPLNEMVRLWSRITGKRQPRAFIPSSLVRPLAGPAALLSAFLPVPGLLSADAIASLGATYAARADKAQDELGWSFRPLEEGLQKTFDAIEDRYAAAPEVTIRRKRNIFIALSAAAAGLVAVLLLRRRRK